MPFFRSIWVISVCFVYLLPAAADDSGPPVRASIEATLSDDGDLLEGRVILSITNNTTETLNEIPLWLYPNRFLDINPRLNEGMLRWFYPKGRSPGGMAISRVEWNGMGLTEETIQYESLYVATLTSKRMIARVRLSTPLPPGDKGVLAIDFRVTIPAQRGRFGRHRDVVSLAGGWFPRPMTDLTGRDLSLPVDIIDVDLRLRLPGNRGAVIADRIYPKRDGPRVVEALNLRSEAITVVVMHQLEISKRRYEWGEAVHVHQEVTWDRARWRETLDDENGEFGRLPEPGRFNRSERLFDIVGHTVDLLHRMAPSRELKKRIVLVDIPAWDRMVQTGPGPVLVSDRLWRLLPVEGAFFFHDLAVVRAVSAELAWNVVARREPPFHRYIVADMVGTYMVSHYSKEIHQKQRSVEDIIGFASVFPTIDNLLYAPQIPFREVYFPSVEEPDPFRDEPWYFMNELPRGKRVLGKLEDLLGKEEMGKFITALIKGDRGVYALTDERLDGAEWFFNQWYGAYPRVNYRLGEIRDTRLADGKVLHRIDVFREGAVIREPVTVRLEDADGVRNDMVWNSDGFRETLEWVSAAPIEHVEIDPAHRVVEAAELTGGHPFADNTNRLPWRPPMFTRLVVWGDLTAGEPYAQLGFWFRRRYDVTNVFSLDLEYTPSAYGGALSFYRFFGKKRTLNARSLVFGPTVAVTHYNGVTDQTLEIPDETRSAATMAAVGLSLGRDSRVYGWDPLTGTAAGIGGSYAIGRADDGRTVHVGRISGRAGTLLSPGIRNTVAIYGGLFGVLGDPVAANLATLSDRTLLRGFDSDETYGRLGFYAVMEYRHTIVDAAHVAAPLYSWFDRFQGVLFTGGGTISEPGSYSGVFDEHRIYTEVGYGLRIHLLLFGFQQYIIAFDVAAPITPVDRYRLTLQSDGTVATVRRSPYKVFFGITQTF